MLNPGCMQPVDKFTFIFMSCQKLQMAPHSLRLQPQATPLLACFAVKGRGQSAQAGLVL
jgi:hypothetical protein